MPRTKWTPTGRKRGRQPGWRKAAFLPDGTPNLTPKQREGIAAEARHWHRRKWRPAREVAQEIGVSVQAVRGWRRLSAYVAAAQAAENDRVYRKLNARLDARAAMKKHELAARRAWQATRRERALRGLPAEVGGPKAFDPAVWVWLPGTPWPDEDQEG